VLTKDKVTHCIVFSYMFRTLIYFVSLHPVTFIATAKHNKQTFITYLTVTNSHDFCGL